jgi:glycosyltransferase involved in cell wall biosynthesis
MVSLPFSDGTRLDLLKSCLAWRLIDLGAGDQSPIDLVITTRFPSYLVQHPNKVVWLIHQYRQGYDLLGTSYSDYGHRPEDRKILQMVRAMDNRALGSARVYAIAHNVADRLRRFNDLEAETLYPPPKLDGQYCCEAFDDFIFAVSRLDRIKRMDLVVKAMKHVRTPVRCLIAGTGPEMDNLRALVAGLGLEDRVKLLGWIDDDKLLELYSRCLAVYFAPQDEDYGLITVEAFKSGKPIITSEDSGAVLEFVSDGENGLVCRSASPREFADKIDILFHDPGLARRMGRNGSRRVGHIQWDRVVETLTGRSHAGE